MMMISNHIPISTAEHAGGIIQARNSRLRAHDNVSTLLWPTIYCTQQQSSQT